MSLHIVILAAGQGKRMHSSTPKVLHSVAGKAMLEWVVDAALHLKPEVIHVVIGFGGEIILKALPDLPVKWVFQAEQLGTGHAVLQALVDIPATSQVLVMSADVPLIKVSTLKGLVDLSRSADKSPLCLLTAKVVSPVGLGRILRNKKQEVLAIIEEKDASSVEREINEIYSGICSTKASHLLHWLPKLTCQNAQGEYYLTEIIGMAVEEGVLIETLLVEDEMEIQGVNNRVQLQTLERECQHRTATALMLSGVTLLDASRIDIRGELSCGKDVTIDINNVFKGNVEIGDGTTIGSHCEFTNVIVGKNCEILSHSVLSDCQIGDNCQIGPFARLRPGTVLGTDCKIGNFVETKNAVFDSHSKASHLSYLGDVTIGKEVNIGAGTITCNYDGVFKHQTVIEDGVFVGSDTQLVAPVTIGKGATIAAGSTISKDAPAGELTLTEAKQKTIFGWIRPKKRDK